MKKLLLIILLIFVSGCGGMSMGEANWLRGVQRQTEMNRMKWDIGTMQQQHFFDSLNPIYP